MENKYGSLPEPQLSSNLIDLIKSGKVYSLQKVLERDIPVFKGHAPFSITPYVRHGETDDLIEGEGGFASELTIMGQHTGTHIDALCHFSKRIGDERYVYGGESLVGAQSYQGITKWSIDQMPPIVSRGILLDIPRMLGVEVLRDSYSITADDIRRCEDIQGIQIKQGDCVIVRTGFMKYWKSENDRYLTSHAGVNLEGAKYLVEKGAIAVGADTTTFEVIPSPKHEVHIYLLVEQGVPIMECLDVEELSKDEVYEFLYIVAPLKLKGSTASIINPIAIK